MMGQRDWLFQQEARKPRAVGETLRRFWAYFRRYTFVLIAVAVLVVLSTYFQVSIPNLMGQAVDCYLVPSPTTCWYTVANPQATAAQNIAGLSGLGDLLATCASPLHRNYRAGRPLAGGERLDHHRPRAGQPRAGY